MGGLKGFVRTPGVDARTRRNFSQLADDAAFITDSTTLELVSGVAEVQDLFLRNDANDTTVGILTMLGFSVNPGLADQDSVIAGDTEANLFYVDAGNDRVGIGTATPATTFDVVGELSAKNLTINTAEADLDSRFAGSGETNLLFVDAGLDRVGVGTGVPSLRFDVKGLPNTTFTNCPLLVQFHTTTGYVAGMGGGISLGGMYDATHSTTFGYVAGLKENGDISNTSGKLVFGTTVNGAGGADKTRMTILSTGAVGINTTTPDAKLQVVGDCKFGDDNTNYSTFETDGTLVFTGDATVWDDINVGGINLFGPLGLRPDIDEFLDEVGAGAGIYTYALAVGEALSGSFEMEHRYKEGTNFTFHVHWQGIVDPTGTKKVQWQLTYTIGKTGETLDAKTEITIETNIDTQYEFNQSNFTAITGTDIDIEDQFLFTLERIAASANEYGGDALLATVGIHIEIDTVGSRQISAK